MSGRNPYANGYGYPSDSGRSENGGYGGSSGLGVNGYGGGGNAGGGGNRDRERERERRPGGYGGFMNEEPQRPPTSSSTLSRERIEIEIMIAEEESRIEDLQRRLRRGHGRGM